MINHHEKFRFIDEDKRNEWFAEVNWNKKDLSSLIKFTFPNGDTSIISRKHLNSFLFAIGSADEQRNLVPINIVKTKWYESTVGIQAKRDIYKGEKINVAVKFPIPIEAWEQIGPKRK